MSVLTITPQFLYPKSRQFPFDEVAEKIVRALEKRNWKVEGITVEFDNFGSGESKYQRVKTITGDYFKLWFCRIQGRINSHLNDIAALYSITIPKQVLEVFDDESGPRYYRYVGDNWEAEKEWFMNSVKVHAKLNKEPRRYLQYSGNTYQRRAKWLVADNDLDREYSPEGDEPVRINLEEKFEEITNWLEENVLNYILSFPEEETIQTSTLMGKLIPYKGPFSTIYGICGCEEAERIKKGMEDPCQLLPEDRHAYFGNGRRLVPLDVNCNDRFSKMAYEGFIWCDANPKFNEKGEPILLPDVQNVMTSSWQNEQFMVAVKLKYANEVYVADNAKYTETRKQLFDTIAPRDILTGKELGNALAARGATIVPITEYKGCYKEPIVLINRELDFDEIERIF